MDITQIEELITKLQPLLDSLAVKLGTTSEYLWKILMKQVYVEAAQDLVAVVFFSIFTYVGIRGISWAKKDMKRENRSDYDDTGFYVMIGSIAAIVFSAVVILACLNSFVAKIINPEYQSIKMIFDFIKDGASGS